MVNPLEKLAELIGGKSGQTNPVGGQSAPTGFAIDLLKGRGIPVKTSPQGITIIAAGIAVPFIIVVIMFSIYLNNRVAIPIMERELAVYNQKMQTLSEGVRAQQMFYKDRDSINASAPEVASAVLRFTAWSPVVQAIAENVPGAMVLSRLDAKQSANSQPGTGAASAAREVGMSISGKAAGNWDEEVKGFRDRLLESSTLKSRLQDIPVSQQSSKGGEKDAVTYDLRMVFKGGM